MSAEVVQHAAGRVAQHGDLHRIRRIAQVEEICRTGSAHVGQIGVGRADDRHGAMDRDRLTEEVERLAIAGGELRDFPRSQRVGDVIEIRRAGGSAMLIIARRTHQGKVAMDRHRVSETRALRSIAGRQAAELGDRTRDAQIEHVCRAGSELDAIGIGCADDREFSVDVDREAEPIAELRAARCICADAISGPGIVQVDGARRAHADIAAPASHHGGGWADRGGVPIPVGTEQASLGDGADQSSRLRVE